MDWELSKCCDSNQLIVLSIIFGWVLITILLWRVPYVLLPLKFLTVFLHEFGHALATWGTGGIVKNIEVNTNQGGSTITVGGNRFIILSAGYLGSCIWGAIILLMGAISIWTTRVISAILMLILFLVLIKYAGNWFVRCLNFLFIIYIGLAWYFTELYNTIWPIRIVLIQIGVLSSIYSIYDIYDHLILGCFLKSDAYKMYELTGVSPRIWGLIWVTIALSILAFTIYLLLVIDAVGGSIHF